MKKALSILIIVIFVLSSTVALAKSEIQYDIDNTAARKVNYCAYNGENYVLVGNRGLISVSADLKNWNEIKGVCYTDINKIIWDGENFVFLSNHNVYKSKDGYSWSKKKCDFEDSNDFDYVNNKYIVHKFEYNPDFSSVLSMVGVTTDFSDFVEINFDSILEEENIEYTFSPNIYYMDKIYFAKGLISNIIWSKDLVNWSRLPVLPNKSDNTKKELLFTSNSSEYLVYYIENSKVVCYSLSKANLENATEWKRTEIGIDFVWDSASMQKSGDEIYIIGALDGIYRAS